MLYDVVRNCSPFARELPRLDHNYSEACSTPKTTYSDENDHHLSTMKENSHVQQHNSKYPTLSQHIHHFRVFAECIFLYNCELWTTTKTINNSIDSFHRRQLRYALGIIYPRVITNQQLYDVTKCEPWSVVTERRRLSWLGHLMR